MQLEAIDAVDTIILAPAVGGAVRAAAEQAVQHGQERRALQREVMLARARQAFDHAPTARLLPHPFEGQRRPDAPGRDRRRLAAVERIKHDRLLGEARSRAQKPLQLPALPQILDPPERRDHLLAHRGALAPALDDLKIGATAGGLLAEIHGGKPDDNSILVRTLSAPARTKSTETSARRGTTFSRPLPVTRNPINTLRRARMLQLSKISQTRRSPRGAGRSRRSFVQPKSGRSCGRRETASPRAPARHQSTTGSFIKGPSLSKSTPRSGNGKSRPSSRSRCPSGPS